MALFDTGERTEPATARKRQEAREQGQVARSHDLSSALVLLAVCLALHFLGLPALDVLGGEVSRGFHLLHEPRLDITAVSRAVGAGFLLAGEVLLPLIALLFAVGAAANLVQVGFLVS